MNVWLEKFKVFATAKNDAQSSTGMRSKTGLLVGNEFEHSFFYFSCEVTKLMSSSDRVEKF